MAGWLAHRANELIDPPQLPTYTQGRGKRGNSYSVCYEAQDDLPDEFQNTTQSKRHSLIPRLLHIPDLRQCWLRCA
jgi:hypothetical protein